MDFLDTILKFFIAYGYYFLFLATVLENIPVVGIFLPGELIVVAAGFSAARGNLDLVTVMIVAGAGAFAGTIVSYMLGFWGGRTLIEVLASKFRMNGDRIKKADEFFSTRGPIAVFVGRYLTGVKAFIPALAGAHRMRFLRFAAFALLGIVSWTILAGLLGYFFGANWRLLIKTIKAASWIILAVIIVIVAVMFGRRERQ